jgi:BlaI family transcriptional regulator, penicillinase repressor
MARPKNEQPTPAELEVLQLLWESGPMTVREVMEHLKETRERAYTSVMSLLNVMADKQLVERSAKGRAFVYAAANPRDATLGEMINDFLSRAFDGSAKALVTQLLDQSSPDEAELKEIKKVIDQYVEKQRESH